MSIFKRINNFFNNDSDQPDDQPTKIVWTKISEPVGYFNDFSKALEFGGFTTSGTAGITDEKIFLLT